MIVVSIKKQREKIKIVLQQKAIGNTKKQEYLNKKCLRHSMNEIPSKGQRIEIYEINKISFSCFDDTIYFENNGYEGLALSY